MRRSLAIGLVLMGACFTARAHDVITTKVTWSREISRLAYKRCGNCHRPGGSAFSLMTYEEARPWAKAIKEETLERRMPPWGAVKGFGEFRDEQALSMEELELISDWVEGGAPEGDPKLLPPPPDYKVPERATKVKSQITLDASLTLKSPVAAIGLLPRTVSEGKSVKVFAQRPDGTIEPLLWLYDYKAQFDRTYYFRRPLSFPAGTRIVCSPRGTGTLSLLTSTPKPAR